MTRLQSLTAEATACVLCEKHIDPRPIFRVGPRARLVIIGQAPGAKVHASGVPWQDDSGDHLLEWLGVDRATFDDPDHFALLPMGFCFPGSKEGGDLPPRAECAPAWHQRFLKLMPRLELQLLVGQYAQASYLGKRVAPTLTETVKQFQRYLPTQLPLPHPSWRSKLWMKKNPWFERKVLPLLRARVRAALAK